MNTKREGRARHSVRAVRCQTDTGAHGVVRPTSQIQFMFIRFHARLKVHCDLPNFRSNSR